MRMGYSESLLMFLMLLVFIGINSNWPVWLVVLLAGASTAVRPVGIALAPVAIRYAALRLGETRWQRTMIAFVAVPFVSWGLMSYVCFQWLSFDDGLAFAKTQVHWRMRDGVPLAERLTDLITLEPIRSTYDATCDCFWGRKMAVHMPAWSSIEFFNPLVFVAFGSVLIMAFFARAISVDEAILAAGLMLIPYLTKSHENCMLSQARFASVVFPVYFALGHFLNRVPYWIVALGTGILGYFLGMFAGLFAASYTVF